MKENSNNRLSISILALAIVFVVAMVIFRICNVGDLPAQFTGALLGSVITCIITLLLLQGQSSSEELKKRNMTIFEKKQEVYHNFLEKLQQIVQDGEISINCKDENGKIDKTVDELKDLIFQIGYLQLHTSKDTIESVLSELACMIQSLNDFNAIDEADKQKHLAEFYLSFSNSLFIIVSILKKDLYNISDSDPIKKEDMQKVLEQCNLYVETNTLNPKELQRLFWSDLQDKMINKGYKFEKRDFRSDIEQYYAKARNRYRNYGFSIPIKTNDGKEYTFKVEVENNYYYGITRPEENFQDEKVSSCLSEIGFSSSAWWFGYKYPSNELDLDFWRMNSNGFKELNDSRKRDAFMDKIANEIDYYINEFLKKSNK
ncbi:MAG TPA: hypothetical protein PLN63_01415 [Paludibacteraceae bacterium]|nr:hypothetical protein [Paludibacteraceae bacterium]HOU67121.1 hypothetical protein [Paludibacteraceae bacterium]HPH62270.1 hypothetical protein [Paludibacteraceae bacterium]HQF49293.1 hypothetical protein [Paludibacteraceae bacterium]HQK40170.1 hypothetical protein [Flavobacterium alvei]